MSINNTFKRYGSVSMAMHWLTVLLVMVAYFTMEYRGLWPKGSVERDLMKQAHFLAGFSILALTLLRMSWRFSQPHPAIEPALQPRMQVLAKLGHLVLYAILLGLPLAGWVALSGWGKPIEPFGLAIPVLIGEDKALAKTVIEWHETVAKLGYWLIGAHALIALWHHAIRKDNTLKRMLPLRG
ncbi:cytochrome b [Atopomonas sediminilitoris]|uniref:cytochrome b n=1 Tax=Atopomonas sediminilitoris TaxID=2919919 RepID=UPI001F4D84B9|nr:cytochrome b [Atopomonas sediminilitoris]MCJ8170030.1 cytochrome b [Atopomonas sediminilitoris]